MGKVGLTPGQIASSVANFQLVLHQPLGLATSACPVILDSFCLCTKIKPTLEFVLAIIIEVIFNSYTILLYSRITALVRSVSSKCFDKEECYIRRKAPALDLNSSIHSKVTMYVFSSYQSGIFIQDNPRLSNKISLIFASFVFRFRVCGGTIKLFHSHYIFKTRSNLE